LRSLKFLTSRRHTILATLKVDDTGTATNLLLPTDKFEVLPALSIDVTGTHLKVAPMSKTEVTKVKKNIHAGYARAEVCVCGAGCHCDSSLFFADTVAFSFDPVPAYSDVADSCAWEPAINHDASNDAMVRYVARVEPTLLQMMVEALLERFRDRPPMTCFD